METLFSIIHYGFVGFFGLIGALFVLVLLFGKRVETKWDFEADFLDERGREIGEFEAELRRIPKEENDFTLDARLRLRHPALEVGRSVQVELEGVLVMEGPVEKPGRVFLQNEHLCGEITDPKTGHVCSVQYQGSQLVKGELHPD